jgi:recombination protein RecT
MTQERPPTNTALQNTPPRSNRNALVADVQSGLEKMRPQFQVMLPSHIKPEAFERVVMTAVNNSPDLLDADRRSLFLACTLAAQDGLLPDKREGALVIYKDKTGKKLVQWMPMVYGLIKKMRQSGEITNVIARIVYQKEIDSGRFTFTISDGEEHLHHDPMLWGDRGEKVLVYASAKFKDGHVEAYPMHKTDVMKRKAMSKSSSGPWQSWEEEMWLKTAIRYLAKKLPLSAEMMSAIGRDEPSEFDRMKTAAQDIGAAAALLASQAHEEIIDAGDASFDPETGEIIVGTHEENQALTAAEEMLLKAFEGLDDLQIDTVTKVDEFAARARALLDDCPITDEERSKINGRFNTAVLTKTRELLKKGKQ